MLHPALLVGKLRGIDPITNDPMIKLKIKNVVPWVQEVEIMDGGKDCKRKYGKPPIRLPRTKKAELLSSRSIEASCVQYMS